VETGQLQLHCAFAAADHVCAVAAVQHIIAITA
jgi:hypothetical protein